MEQNTEKKTGLFNTYPYEKIVSRESFKNRPLLRLGQNTEPAPNEFVGAADMRVFMEVDIAQYPDFPIPTEEDPKWQDRIDFALHRLLDYACSLDQAENQISDILHDTPFLLEEFGFTKVVGVDNPSLYKKEIFRMWRIDDNDWAIVGKDKNFSVIDIIATLPSYKVAYTVLTALGIYKEGEQKALSITVTDEEVEAGIEHARIAEEKLAEQRKNMVVAGTDKTVGETLNTESK